MRIAIGSDHAGFDLKEEAKAFLVEENQQKSLTSAPTARIPWIIPITLKAVGEALLAESLSRARHHHLCGSGVGASMAANRIPGIRAGLCHDTYSAHQGVEHDNMNVLVLGGPALGGGIELARES